MLYILTVATAFCLLLPALSIAAPIPREVQVPAELYDMIHGLSARDEVKRISSGECKEQRKGGFEFCAEGRNLCESRDDKNNLKWEFVEGSSISCPSSGWTRNPSIVSIKITRSTPEADPDTAPPPDAV
ncbi:hypothetical protein GGTG_09119 [Gaeumannomyces tritici R3-111a-1]|uniref:Uncharacterized protein n=1 Tax=Gaeumannomyces tritici (strain R3-111a-1) TaxID=644352 RepID=J3P6H8_GAET3|nr:hypothetical protein GGTG_09119 [Gaeumannomyces tritici R3-111a-1]EJT72253.1 hypothetical protein GGTG_09119 [Gaeumannomyces tritici R3-111a-1]